MKCVPQSRRAEEALLAQLPGRCFPEEMPSILSQMTLVRAGFAVFQGRACGCIQGTSAYRSLETPSRTMQTPHTLSGGHSFCSLACQVSFCLLGRQIELGSAHTYQSYNIWEGVETLGFFGLTGESGNKKHPHRRFLSGKWGRSLYSSSLPLTPRTFLPSRESPAFCWFIRQTTYFPSVCSPKGSLKSIIAWSSDQGSHAFMWPGLDPVLLLVSRSLFNVKCTRGLQGTDSARNSPIFPK